jgi:transcriptional regulator GlxA family with amidase domain
LRPKAWLRKQRLHAARAVLNDRSRKIKITSLAHDFCFHSPSEFAQHYLVEFGESPSETMRKNMR